MMSNAESDVALQYASALTEFVDHYVPNEQHPPTRRAPCNRDLHQRLLQVDATIPTNDLHALRFIVTRYITPENGEVLMQAVNKTLACVSPNLYTRDTFMSQTRKQVIAKLGEHSSEWKLLCSIVTVPRADRQLKQQLARQQLVQKNRNIRVMTYETLRRVAEQWNRSSDIFKWIPLVQLSIGCRLCEALFVSDVSLCDQPQHVRIVGTAKTVLVKTLVRPVLFLTPERLVDLVRRVQAYVQQETYRLGLTTRAQVSSLFNKRVNAVVQGQLPSAKSHSLREMYAYISFVQYGQGRVSLTAWIVQVLGHHEEYLNCALHYQGFYAPDVPAPNASDFMRAPAPGDAARDDNAVTLRDANGMPVSLQRHRIMRDGSSSLYLARKLQELARANVSIRDDAAIKRLGFGSGAIAEYRKAQKRQKRGRDELVEFEIINDRSGHPHAVAKKPKLRDGQTQERVAEARRELESRGIEPTNRTLRKLGISARSLREERIHDE